MIAPDSLFAIVLVIGKLQAMTNNLLKHKKRDFSKLNPLYQLDVNCNKYRTPTTYPGGVYFLILTYSQHWELC